MTKNIDPTRDQFQEFKGLDRETTIDMFNLVRFRARANYPDDRECTGAEAYARYGQASAEVFQRVGGEIRWRGSPENMLIGPADERWDVAFIARYPNAHAFLAMVSDPEYKLAVVHRQAAVEDSRLIRTAPITGGATFS